MNQAINLSSNGAMNIQVGTPFVIYLGVFYYLLGHFLGIFLATRISMIFLSGLIVILLYLFAMRIGGRIFGFLSVLFIIFEPLFITYSTVPHNDIFAIAMLLLSLYFLTSERTLLRYLSPVFFYMAIFTRAEYTITVIPIGIFLIINFFQVPLRKAITKFFIPALLYAAPIIALFSYVQTFTRYTLWEKFSLFVTPSQLRNTFTLALSISNNPFVDLIFSITIFGTFIFVITRFAYYILQTKKLSVNRYHSLSLLLFLIFLFHLIAITAYGYGYTIVNGNLQISNWLTERYLIFPQLLLSFLIAYPLSLSAERVYSSKKIAFFQLADN
jgi:hypothetical protein